MCPLAKRDNGLSRLTRKYKEDQPIPIHQAALETGVNEGLLLHLIRSKRLKLYVRRGKHCVRISDVHLIVRENRDEEERQRAANRERVRRTPLPEDNHHFKRKSKSQRRRERREAQLKRLNAIPPMPIENVASILGISEQTIWNLIERTSVDLVVDAGVPSVRIGDVMNAQRVVRSHVNKETQAEPTTPAREPESSAKPAVRHETKSNSGNNSSSLAYRASPNTYRVSGHITSPGTVVSQLWREYERLEKKQAWTGTDHQRWAFVRNVLSQIDPEGYEERIGKKRR